MNDEIGLGTGSGTGERGPSTRRLVPMRVGEAAVYVEVAGTPPGIEEDEIYVASAIEPEDVFGEAGRALKECVRVVGEQMATLRSARPGQQAPVHREG